MRGSISRILAGISVLLLAVLVLEWTGGGEEPVVRAPVTHKPNAAAPTDSEGRDTSEWSATILARPLFSSNRRPPKVAKGAGTAGAPMPRLAGIMITPQGRRAIFAPDGGGKQLVLAEGANVNDVAIRSIQPDRVILASGAVLTLAYDKQRGSGTTTQPFVPIQPNLPQPGFAPQGGPGNPGGLNPQGLNPMAIGPNGGPFPNRGFPNPRVLGQFPGVNTTQPVPADSTPDPSAPTQASPNQGAQADPDDSDAAPAVAPADPSNQPNQTETPPVPRPGPQRRE